MCVEIDFVLTLKVGQNNIPLFLEIFSKGIFIKTRAGESIKAFLIERFGLDEEYAEHRIQTVFLNGKPVDDINTALLSYESVIALSAAMPGLVGAVMRKGGYYASLRDKITHRENLLISPAEDTVVRLKLFNVISRELGPELLRSGVIISLDYLKKLVEKHGESFNNITDEIWMNERLITFKAFTRFLMMDSDEDEFIELKIVPGHGTAL